MTTLTSLGLIMTIRNNKHGIVCFLFFLIHVSLHATAQMATESAPPQPFQPSSEVAPTFNPTMALAMLVLISAMFLMGFFSVSIRQCLERRLPSQNNADPYAVFLRGADHQPRRASPGLDASVMSTFPAFVYSSVKGLKIGKGPLECAVCLNEFEDDETLRLLPKCRHVFHTDCIDAWLASHTTCPVCRTNLVPEPGENISCVVQIFNSGCDSGEPELSSDNTQEVSQSEQRRDTESPYANLTNQNRPPRSRSTGWRLASLFPRSHSTGHSLVQPGENYERFTLTLPEKVRNQLMNSTLNRSKSCVALPRVRSSRRGFRSGSGGFGCGRNKSFYEWFDRPSRSGHWPFFSRTGSVRSPRATGGGDEVTCAPKNLFKFVKSSSDSLLTRRDNEGERSFDRLRSDSQV